MEEFLLRVDIIDIKFIIRKVILEGGEIVGKRHTVVILIFGITIYGIISELVMPNVVFWQRSLLFLTIFVPLAYMLEKKNKEREIKKYLSQQ